MRWGTGWFLKEDAAVAEVALRVSLKVQRTQNQNVGVSGPRRLTVEVIVVVGVADPGSAVEGVAAFERSEKAGVLAGVDRRKSRIASKHGSHDGRGTFLVGASLLAMDAVRG